MNHLPDRSSYKLLTWCSHGSVTGLGFSCEPLTLAYNGKHLRCTFPISSKRRFLRCNHPTPIPSNALQIEDRELWEILFPGFFLPCCCTNDLRIDVSNQMARRKLHVGTNAFFWFLIPFFLQEDFSSLTLD